MSAADDPLAYALARADVDPGERAAFYAALRAADVWLLAPSASNERGLHLVPCAGDDGPFVPMFSSPEQMQAVVGRGSGYGAIALRAADVLPLLAAQGVSVSLNPGTPHGRTFAPDEVSAIADGSLSAARPVGVHGDAAARVRRPRRTPAALLRRLSAVFARYADVAEAWLGELLLDDGLPHLVVGVKAAHGYDAAVAEAGPIAQGHLPPGQVIDFLHVPYACAPDGIGGWLVRETDAFYRRDRRRWWQSR